MALTALRWAILLIALAPLAYYLLAIYCTWDYFKVAHRESASTGHFAPPVSILKPVRGIDREAYENFMSFCRQDYSQFEILFAVADADDPVLPLLQRLKQEFPEHSIRVIQEVPQLGPNRKLNNLAALSRAASYELLVISDSDVRVDGQYLRRVAARFSDSKVGAVTAFFRGITAGGLGAQFEAMVLSTETVPNALVARKIEGKVQFAFGWTMATTKTHLNSIGGFEDMVYVHSDDFELGNRIAAKGLAIELLPVPVDMVFPRESFADYLRHELRWAIGLRNVRPGGYWGLLFTFGLPWTIVAILLAPTSGCAIGYAASYLTLRLFQVWLIGVWGLNDPVTRKSWWLTPVRDAINFVVWLAGFFTSQIKWRGVKYKVKRGNKLVPV
ncbi:MAG: bacteriohopanetetrol glucosamine biosynthesis glycosyltransferase HpnI [Candidatus Acidiferrum sp.]